MSLTPVSSSDKDIGGVPSMQSSYSAEMRRYGICMEERSVIVKCIFGLQFSHHVSRNGIRHHGINTQCICYTESRYHIMYGFGMH